MRNLFKLALILVLSLGLAVAQQAQEEREQTIAQIIAEHPELSTFYKILQSANLLETFAEQAAAEAETGDVGITVFAPSNAAFEALSEAELEAIRADPQALLVAHHVEQEAYTLDALSEQPISEEFTHVVRSDDAGNLMIDEAAVVEGDLLATNGVIHIVDQLLVTADILSGTVEEDSAVEGGGAGEEQEGAADEGDAVETPDETPVETPAEEDGEGNGADEDGGQEQEDTEEDM